MDQGEQKPDKKKPSAPPKGKAKKGLPDKVKKNRKASGKKEERWTDKQELFCQEYAVDFNASRAARAAGYSEDTAGAIGAENLKKPQIQKRVNEILDTRAASSAVTKERIVQELARIAFAGMPTFARFKDGKLEIIDTDKISPADQAAISQLTQKSGNTSEKSIKLHDKTKALELLARHKNILSEDSDAKFSGVVFIGTGENIGKV